MNTKCLAKLYDRLTPRERLPLILAASARDDEVEGQRLAQSAPRMALRLPDYHGLGEGLFLASLFHLIGVLDVAALFWLTQGRLAEWQAWADEKEDEDDWLNRMDAKVRMLAYVLTAKRDGWRRFCAELPVDPELLLNDVPAYDTVKRSEEAARLLAFSVDEARAWLRKTSTATAEVVTAESEAAAIGGFVNSREKWWG
jgi:hypothetical protein